MNNAVFGKSLVNFMFIRSFMFLCFDSFTDPFIAGKTIDNLRNWRTAGLVTTEEKLKKLTAETAFKQFKILSENL